MLVGRPPRQGLGEAGHRSESSQHLVGDGVAAGRPRRRGWRHGRMVNCMDLPSKKG